jgi:hypothetical protein
MTWPAVITMILVMTVIWGGFLAALIWALRGERRKKETGPDA